MTFIYMYEREREREKTEVTGGDQEAASGVGRIGEGESDGSWSGTKDERHEGNDGMYGNLFSFLFPFWR